MTVSEKVTVRGRGSNPWRSVRHMFEADALTNWAIRFLKLATTLLCLGSLIISNKAGDLCFKKNQIKQVIHL